MQQQEFDD
jgi:hypothetical protein